MLFSKKRFVVKDQRSVEKERSLPSLEDPELTDLIPELVAKDRERSWRLAIEKAIMNRFFQCFL